MIYQKGKEKIIIKRWHVTIPRVWKACELLNLYSNHCPPHAFGRISRSLMLIFSLRSRVIFYVSVEWGSGEEMNDTFTPVFLN